MRVLAKYLSVVALVSTYTLASAATVPYGFTVGVGFTNKAAGPFCKL
jgi:hypothetical protein